LREGDPREKEGSGGQHHYFSHKYSIYK
jgi:hypothetical protein